MKVPGFLLRRLQRWAVRAQEREPDLYIGGRANPYLLRWYVIPRNPIFNLYLHRLLRSDDDRALHDHPWLNCSVIVDGGYVEHTIAGGGIHRRTARCAGELKLRRSVAAHRLEIGSHSRTVTLFITGPRLRSWGFHCPERGWVHWLDFTAGDKGELVGRGCGDPE